MVFLACTMTFKVKWTNYYGILVCYLNGSSQNQNCSFTRRSSYQLQAYWKSLLIITNLEKQNNMLVKTIITKWVCCSCYGTKHPSIEKKCVSIRQFRTYWLWSMSFCFYGSRLYETGITVNEIMERVTLIRLAQ